MIKKLKLKQALVNLVLAGSSLIITLVVIELLTGILFCSGVGQFLHAPTGWPAVRGVGAVTDPDPTLGWRGRPGLQAWFYDYYRCPTYQSKFVHNSRGFRDQERDYARQPQARRLIVLGDSYTWGWGVEQNYATLLQDKFKVAQLPIEVINLGVIGYDTAQELLMYEQQGASYQPDMVLLAFCVNDYGENAENWTWGYARPRFAIEADGSLRLTDDPPKVPRPAGSPYATVARYWLTDHSLTYRLAGRVVLRDRSQVSAEEKRLTLALVDALRAGVQASGARFAVMMVPGPEQVLSPAVAAPDWYTSVVEWSANTGTWLLEPLTELRASQQAGQRLYFLPQDPHWTQTGHQRVADYLFERLQDTPGLSYSVAR